MHESNADEIQQPKATKVGAQTHRQPKTDTQPEEKIESAPVRHKTAKLDLKDTLEQIKTNLNSLNANLKKSQPATKDYGTTFRTEIYTSEPEPTEHVMSPGLPQPHKLLQHR